MTRICVGTKAGFLVYRTEDFERVWKKEVPGGCAIVDVLDDTFVVAIVGTGNHPTSSRRHVQVLNMKQVVEVAKLAFESPVITIKMNRKRFVVVLEGEIQIFDMERLSLCNKIHTSPNPAGVSSLSYSTKSPMRLAYPATRGSLHGDLVLFDPIGGQQVDHLAQVQDHPLACIEFSPDGEWIATASSQGTRIMAFRLSDPSKKYVFRRGSKQADISSIAFSPDASFMAVSSSTPTIHVFRPKEEETKKLQTDGSGSWLNMAMSSYESAGYAQIKLSPTKKLVGFAGDNSNVLYAITQDGKFYQWRLEAQEKDKPFFKVVIDGSSLLRDYE